MVEGWEELVPIVSGAGVLVGRYVLSPFIMRWSNYRHVAEVIDGDTIDVRSFWFERLAPEVGATLRLRLNRINAPDVSPAKDEAREALKRKLGEVVRVHVIGPDKYGRLLAELYQKTINLNDWLVRKGHARYYDGGARQKDY